MTSSDSVGPVLTTDRLEIRPLASEDVDIAIAIWCDPEVTRFICEPATEEETRKEMTDAVRRSAGGGIGVWCVIERSTGKKLGSTYLLPMPVEEDDFDYSILGGDDIPAGDIEVGYFLVPDAWGRGYASEICDRMLRFGFEVLDLDEIVASVNEDNLASQAVLQKNGMRYSERAMCWGQETPLYRLSRADWSLYGQLSPSQ